MNEEMDKTEAEPLFKCNVCGCEELEVIRWFTRSTRFEATVPCDCGEDEVAAVRRYRIDALCEQSGSLDEGHHFDLGAPEEIECLDTEEEEYEVHCPACLEEADERCWVVDPQQEEAKRRMTSSTCSADTAVGRSSSDGPTPAGEAGSGPSSAPTSARGDAGPSRALRSRGTRRGG